ncbi:uncharacterized protein NCBP2-AS2 homolog [Ctenocephalides felis]|uniref:uncharacterized protein NCBP2-AS2 homolog n=1 Tax=Ctenocephalides felis TaxID=7515 RepID=UPI000E6E5634|nr:uncharacterized protein NCBP2-AS2 homolog [Ctenocephalides felis]
MPLRSLMNYLLNNERLVQKLSESYPVRRAAQLAISLMYRSKSILGDNTEKLANNPIRKFYFIKSFIDNVKEEYKKLREISDKKPK